MTELTPATFARLFAEFRAPSWRAWMDILARLHAAIREFYAAAGRGSGKSRMAALLAAWAGVVWATVRTTRAPGESIYVGVFAPDRKQAGLVLRYIIGLLRSRPELEALIVSETRERIVLVNQVIVEVITASTAAPRGRSYALAIIEEAAFLPAGDDAADPDVELVRALRPALARVPGSLLVVIGSPYARRGILFEAVEGGESTDRIVVTADTLSLNPTFSAREIARAFEVDPVAALSEYGRDGEIDFRRDVSGLLTIEALAAVTPVGVRELAPERGVSATGHFDAATGSGGDAAALGVALVGGPVTRLACVRRWRPPFSPLQVIGEAAAVFRAYGLHQITIDRFAPGLIVDLFREHGVSCRIAERDTSGNFIELLGLVNAGRVQLLDEPMLLNELRRLERRTGASRDVVGHPRGGHDDVSAACAGCLVAAQRPVGAAFGIGHCAWL